MKFNTKALGYLFVVCGFIILLVNWAIWTFKPIDFGYFQSNIIIGVNFCLSGFVIVSVNEL